MATPGFLTRDDLEIVQTAAKYAIGVPYDACEPRCLFHPIALAGMRNPAVGDMDFRLPRCRDPLGRDPLRAGTPVGLDGPGVPRRRLSLRARVNAVRLRRHAVPAADVVDGADRRVLARERENLQAFRPE